MRLWWKLALACTLAACRFDLPDDLCFGTGLVNNLCLAQPPTGTLSIHQRCLIALDDNQRVQN
ncbi:MAG TPA: hypothetical protein VNO30_33355 [Kofleriaceae bacterium]|nr:hypothetical protein [Kofleriaceae bacterium]